MKIETQMIISACCILIGTFVLNKRFYPKLLIVTAVMVLGFQYPCRHAKGQSKTENDKTKPRLVVQTGSDSYISALSFSPDSQYCATVDGTGVVVLWNTDGKQLQRFQIGNDVGEVAFSRDNRLVAIASGGISVRSVASGREINRIASIWPPISFSPNSRLLLGIGPENSALLWDLERKEIVHRFDDSIAAAFSPDGQTIITLAKNGKAKNKETYTLKSWDAATWKNKWENTFERTNDYSHPYDRLTFSYEGKSIIVSSTQDFDYSLLDAAAGSFVSHMGHSLDSQGTARVVSISPNQQYFLECENLSGGSMGLFDNTVVLYDFATGNEIRSLGRIAPIITTIMSTDDKHDWILTGDISGDAHVWDLAEGKEIERLQSPEKSKEGIGVTGQADQPMAGISMDGSIAFTAPLGGHSEKIFIWEVNTGKPLKEIAGEALSISLSMDGHQALIHRCGAGYRPLSLVDLRTQRNIWTQDTDGGGVCSEAERRYLRNTAKLTADGKSVFVGEYRSAGKPALLDATTGKLIRQYSNVAGGAPVSLSRNGRYAAVPYAISSANGTLVGWVVVLLDISNGTVIRRVQIPDFNGAMSFSPDNRFFLLATSDALELLDAGTGKEIKKIGVSVNEINAVDFSPDANYIITGNQDGSTRFYSLRTGEEVCRVFSFQDGNWVVVGPDGRFDTNNLEEINGLLWILPDEPLKPLPLEIFMRDYYEPRLLSRILTGEEVSELPSLAELNRLQPKVEKITVIPRAGKSDLVDVTVEVSSSSGQCLKSDVQVPCESGAYDLRLYRDRQLVKQAPSTDTSSVDFSGGNWRVQLAQWRESSVVKARDGHPITAATGKREITFTSIRLPQRLGVKQVEFTAYAFNEDRVKSATSAPTAYPLPQPRPESHPRAYLITVGVDVTSAGWRLGFARKGVREVEGLLKEKLGSQYEVVPVQLISAYKENSAELVDLATRGNLQTVLNILSGRNVAMTDRQKVPKQEQLRSATPDDLVVLYIASHGYVDPAGTFYVIPSDIGKPRGVSEELLDRCLRNSGQSPICEAARRLLQRSISSDELTQWIEAIDAGQMVLVLDSCHSGAVSGPGFKPGPMGDRSFGQLSYDKGMLVLAATQAEQFDVGNLELGDRSLLTYALTQQQTPPTELFDLRQWLSQAKKQVPELYKRFVGLGRPSTSRNEADQQPALFDFSKGRAKPAHTP